MTKHGNMPMLPCTYLSILVHAAVERAAHRVLGLEKHDLDGPSAKKLGGGQQILQRHQSGRTCPDDGDLHGAWRSRSELGIKRCVEQSAAWEG